MDKPMPAVFVGHGNPMNALYENAYTEGWASIGSSMPRPKAILSVSAHWFIPATEVTVSATPRTIHDFGGFPDELFEMKYPAPGSPGLASRVRDMLAPVAVGLSVEWGLDHGTWTVLHHMFPKADIPVIQLSIDEAKPPAFHYEIGKRLGSLREEGVLIIGSGNVVHNLHSYAWGQQGGKAYDWAVRFEHRVRELIVKGNDAHVVEYEKMGRDAMLSAPTPDHYLPLLYVLGLRRAGDAISFPVVGTDGGSVSMLAVQLG